MVYEAYGANVMFVEKEWAHVLPIDYDTDVIPASECKGGEENIGVPAANC